MCGRASGLWAHGDFSRGLAHTSQGNFMASENLIFVKKSGKGPGVGKTLSSALDKLCSGACRISIQAVGMRGGGTCPSRAFHDWSSVLPSRTGHPSTDTHASEYTGFRGLPTGQTANI